MSLEIKGESCPICKAYLFDDDDIAVCPTCGAPHHRECFISAGKCGLEEFHGSDMQYDILKKNREQEKGTEPVNTAENKEKDILVECPSCHNRYSIKESHCSNCGMQNVYGRAVVMGVDFLGGVKKDEDLGGHTAEKVRNFVVTGTDRVIPKFLKFKQGKKTGFSLWSFLFPAAKFASRKMYKEALLAGVIEIAAVLLMLPLSSIIGASDFSGYAELYLSVYENNPQPFMLATIGCILYFALMLFCGLFADRFYYRHVLAKLSEIDGQVISDEEKFELYRKKGGLSIFAFLITLLAVQYLPGIIFAFIG